jgi:type II secretion system protein I
MKLTIKNRAERGFTLIEVLVALAIASGALILILSANGASLRKSVSARVSERLERIAESKFSEWRLGAERASQGELPEFPGHTWEVRTAREDMAPLRKLRRIRFLVLDSKGPLLEWSELRETAESPP